MKRKTLPKRVALLSLLQSDGPFDLVCMDFLSIEPDSSNTENVLVITDHYTRPSLSNKEPKILYSGKSVTGEIFCPLRIAQEDAQ